ncbi:TPA: hypothetical protein UO481_000906 [Klebsiella pneumoniae]|nr:hypothetical protein [Klebsiella pneumoniae]
MFLSFIVAVEEVVITIEQKGLTIVMSDFKIRKDGAGKAPPKKDRQRVRQKFKIEKDISVIIYYGASIAIGN